MVHDESRGVHSRNDPLKLSFDTARGGKDPPAREGYLLVDGKEYPVKRQDLPTIVESFKTYDDINLVKTGDLGQVRLNPPHLSSNMWVIGALAGSYCIPQISLHGGNNTLSPDGGLLD